MYGLVSVRVQSPRILTVLVACVPYRRSTKNSRQSRGFRSSFHEYKAREKAGNPHWLAASQVSGGSVTNRTSLAVGLKRSANALPPRRNAEITSLLLLTKLAAASSIVYLTGRWFRHHPRHQKRQIQRSFAANTEIHIDSSVPKLLRTSEEKFLKRWFDSPPTGPIVLAGPVASGRSYLIKSVLSDRKMTIYVDFRRAPVVTGEEYIGGVVAAAGYLIPQATEIMRMFTREEQRKTKITPQEAERALAVILDALQECKAKKWVDGIPLICLDDVTVNGIKNAQGNLELDMFWTKFLDWCAYICDAKLAHVVFVPSQAYEPHSPLYDHPIFRSKRILLFVDYPSAEKVRHYVHKFITEQCPSASNSPAHLAHMVDWIVNCLGGQLDDLVHILGALGRGDKYGAVLRRMITDSVSTLEERLEQVLSEAHNPANHKEDVYKKYLRLWSAMEMLRDNEVVNRRDLVRHVFKEHTVELKQYVEWGLMSYANQKAEIDDGANTAETAAISVIASAEASSAATPTTAANTSVTTSLSESSRRADYPLWWNSTTTPATTPKDESSQEPPSGTTAPRRHSTLLNASLESMLVAAGSPRIRIAFDLLLKDERLADRKEAMVIHLQVKSLQDKLDKIEVNKKQRLEELQVVLNEMNRLLTLLSVWREEFGSEFVESRKKRLMLQETEIHQSLNSLQQETDRLLAQKVELEARAKQLSVRL
jgi:hypothetical protein